MKKRFLSIVLCCALAVSMLAGCGKKEEEPAPNEPQTISMTATPTPRPTHTPKPSKTPTPTPTPTPEIAKEKLPDAVAHITFDGKDEGYKAIKQVDKAADSENAGATYDLSPADVAFQYANGAVGKCLYLDGTFGLDLGLKATNTDEYTISFWTNAARLSNFGATLQIGYNMGKTADEGNNVTWLNVTQTDFPGFKAFPVLWSRNEASDGADGTDCWPWMWAFADEANAIKGKKEWVLVTIVSDGKAQKSPKCAETTAGRLYLNGQLVYDSGKNFDSDGAEYGWDGGYTWDATLAPNIMKPGTSKFESLFGINYWDAVFKGFVDDLYVFDKALTDGQVQTLFSAGDAKNEPVVEGASQVEEAEPTAQVVTTIDKTTMFKIGDPDTTKPAFWSSFTDSYQIKDGQTQIWRFHNYGDGLSNWNNYVFAFANTKTKANKAPSADNYEGYAEYGVIRSDAYGWGYTSAEYAYSWKDWNEFLKAMKDANVVMTFTRNGGDIKFDALITTPDGDTFTYGGKVVTTADKKSPMYIFMTEDHCYIEVTSVATFDPKTATIDTVGSADKTGGWWTDWSKGFEVREDKALRLKFKNFGDGQANWDNYVLLFSNQEIAGHSDPNGIGGDYKELGVLRGDAYSWGFIDPTYKSDWDWADYADIMNGADITMDIIREGKLVRYSAAIKGADGRNYTYSGTMTVADEPVFVAISGEKSFQQITSAKYVSADSTPKTGDESAAVMSILGFMAVTSGLIFFFRRRETL